jgi:glycine oxidase
MTRISPDVVVAGAGIVGLSAACELARHGARCVVFDRGRAGSEASSAAGGILSPQSEAPPNSPLLALALRARDRHVHLAEELHRETGRSVEHHREGVLSLAFSREDEQRLTALTEAQRKQGLRAVMVSREDIARLEPAAHPDAIAAALFPDDHRVDNARLLEALKALALSLGVEIREYTALRGVETREGRLVAVRTDNERIEVKTLVNALGAWGSQLDGDTPCPPLRPVKGHMVSLVGGPQIRHVVYGNHGYIVPRGDFRLIVGSTMEEAGFDARVTVESIAHVLAIATRIAPSTKQASIAQTWIGFRPATPDGLPVIGKGSAEGIIVAGGLFRNGILLGPLVGEIAAALAMGADPGHDLAPFDPARFHAGFAMLPA